MARVQHYQIYFQVAEEWHCVELEGSKENYIEFYLNELQMKSPQFNTKSRSAGIFQKLIAGVHPMRQFDQRF